MARQDSRLTRGDAHIGGGLRVGTVRGSTNTDTSDAFLRIPILSTTEKNALTAETGMLVYDETLDKVQAYQNTGWTAVDGTAAGSLDAAYNGGASITVDSGAVTLTDSQTNTAGGLLITKSGVVTGSNDASVFHINSSGAHDTSGTLKMLEISVGTETAGTPIGMEVEMNANGDSALTVTKGAVTLSDGALTLTSGALTMTSGNFTMSAGNADITGTLAVSGASGLQNITASGSYTGQGVMILDVDNAEAFLIRENSDAADVLTIDTTQDAGDTTMLLTTKVTTGSGVHIDGSTVTSGDALKITVAAATMTAAGAALSVVADGSEVFAVRDDGAVFSVAGTAEGTTAIGVTAGDVLISDGDLTLSGGEASITTDAAGDILTLENTEAGATGVVVKANHNSASPADNDIAFQLEVYADDDGGTSTEIGRMVTTQLDVTAATDDAEMAFHVAIGGSLTEMLVLNDASSNGILIPGSAAGTAALTIALGDLVITDTDTTTITSVNGTGNIVEIVSGGAIGAGKGVLEIDAAGTWNATGTGLLISVDGITATNNPYAMRINAAGKDAGGFYIDSDGATDSVCHIHGGGAIANNMALLELTIDGTPANAGSNMLRVDGSGGTNTAKPVLVEVYDDSVSTGLSVTSSPTANDVAIFAGGGALTNGNAVVAISNSGNLAAGGIDLEVVMGGTPNTDARAFEIDAQKDARAVYIDTDAATNDAVTINADGNLAAGKFALLVDIGGTVGTGSGAIKADATGTFGGDERIVEIDAAGKNAIALYVDADPTTNDVVYIHSDAVIAADKAMLNLNHATGNLAAGANILRVDAASGTPNADARFVEIDAAAFTDTNEPYGIFVDAGGKKLRALHVDADPATNDVAYMHTDGATADNKAVLSLSSAGTPAAAGSNVLRVAFTGTDTNKPTLVEVIGSGKDCQGLNVDADPTTTSAVYFKSDGVLGADKATLEIVQDAVSNADSAVLRVEQTNTGGANNVVHLKQDDIGEPFIGFETTAGAGNAINTNATSQAATHHILVDLEGIGDAWIPCSTGAPT